MSEGEKSHVGLMLCFYCLEDAAGIALDRRMRNVLPAEPCVYDMTPCAKCQEHMAKGIILIAASHESLEQLDEEKRQYYQKLADRNYHQRKRKVPPFIPNPYRTGGWLVVSEEFVKRFFLSPLKERTLENRWMFVTTEVADWINTENAKLNTQETPDGEETDSTPQR